MSSSPVASPNTTKRLNNVNSVQALSNLVDETFSHLTVLGAYVTLETEQVSQAFLTKGVTHLLRVTLMMFECYFMLKMISLTVAFPLRRGVFQTLIVLIYNGVVAAMLVTIIDTKLHFCIILSVLWGFCVLLFLVLEGRGIYTQFRRLLTQIPNRIIGVEDPADVKDDEDE
ncbi:hypothetical protein P8452_53766 [Trifolium repens]|jgi:hypothetical protein|nr:hypothetical protein P8452_53766 [Trifolium repens]